jgi:hypothetical protein
VLTNISLHAPIEGPSAWVRRDLAETDYRIELSERCLGEILRTIDELRRFPLPTILRRPDEFDMPHCMAAMVQVRDILDRGVRFTIVDRLPLGEMSEDEAKSVYWLLSSMVARPVAQKLDGTMIYDVHDTAQAALPGSGVRPDQTNIDLKFHNDNSSNATPPDYVGLLCLRPAKRGGHSRVMSFHTVHNALRKRAPELLPRLYRPFWFDRQREFHAGEAPIFTAPVFELGDELRARFSAHQIRGGYALKGEPVDNEGAAAIAALLDIFEDEALSADFDLEPEQIQFVHNHVLGHARTEFEDFPEPGRRRHLVRLWLRDHGRRAYAG